MSRPTVHCVLPNDIDNPRSPSGGNVYDRRLLTGLSAAGWTVREHPVRGDWPHPDATAVSTVERVLASLPAGAVVLLDGLVASTVPGVLVPQAARLRLVPLLHLPLLDEAERAVVRAATAVLTTSAWARSQVVRHHGLAEKRVHVATPGVDPAPVAVGSADGAELLCVGAVTAHKGQDVLRDALAMLDDLPWRCTCVGPLDRDPSYVGTVAADERFRLVGPQTGAPLAARYAAADLLVVPSRVETYGMVVTEALARGIPVLATTAGGLPTTLGFAPDGIRPGLLVPPGDPAALAVALRRWIRDAGLRRRLRSAALGRRLTLQGWSTTAATVGGVLARALAGNAAIRKVMHAGVTHSVERTRHSVEHRRQANGEHGRGREGDDHA
jgi:glycosyltransferase involved in cell wall biosynthesis